jgi:UDP-N-acetylglucosamine:LPS N-acetylglucosamine transferase
VAYLWNVLWSLERRVYADPRNHAIFIGQPDDIPDSRFGPLLPNRRKHALEHYQFVGEVLRFEPADYISNQVSVRERLGIGPDPFVVCSIGGTAIGRELLELCARAAGCLRATRPNLKMLLVTGPRLDPASLPTVDNVEVRGFVPNLHEYFAASDLAVVQGGGTTSLELTALRRPFLYFPLEGWSEQESDVASRNERNRAGERLSLSRTTPEALAAKIGDSLGRPTNYVQIQSDGARKAAEAIAKVIESGA